MSNARLREALNAGNNTKEKGPPVADGILSVTPDTPEAVELRSRRSAIDCVATSSTYLEEESDGPRPHELYGKFTWKIENFSETSKRELRSNVFEVGSYKWYILVYPQGCDVCNHLSLFLCVADYDKLLPGWSHFAQFTIAVVNKDPKKSKYSDTLHRFCKKEHDWGWKKFMELSKVLDGFTVADTLVIKAQVQVIRDRVDRPFRCLDPQYRRELVRVYLTNVEGICRRFVEERRERLAWIRQDPNTFRAFWRGLVDDIKKENILDMEDVILKGVVKRFFNEKEVTSTLVMDALFCGCRQLEEQSRMWFQGKLGRNDDPNIVIDAHQGVFLVAGDVIRVLERAANETIPPCGRDEKAADGSAMRSGQDDESVKDTIERDERRLAELGKRTVEMYVISHIFTEHLEVAYREAESLKRQEALIREEEEAERMEEYRIQLKAQAERERRMKRKEKKRAKKEAERVRREEEESERRRLEQVKRDEVEKKRREEAEKKRKLDEERETERQKALEEAARRAREIERREAEKRKRAQQAEAISAKADTSTSTSTSGSNSGSSSDPQPSRSVAGTPTGVVAAATPQPPQKYEERSVSSKDASSQPSSSAPSTVPAILGGRRIAMANAQLRPNGVNVGIRINDVHQPSAAVFGNHIAYRSIHPHSDRLPNGTDPNPAEVNSLRVRVKDLERRIDEKDTEISRLKAEVSEYQAREKTREVVAADPPSQISQGSQTQPQGQPGAGSHPRQDVSTGTQAPPLLGTPGVVNQSPSQGSEAGNQTPTPSQPPPSRGGAIVSGGNRVSHGSASVNPDKTRTMGNPPSPISHPIDQRGKDSLTQAPTPHQQRSAQQAARQEGTRTPPESDVASINVGQSTAPRAPPSAPSPAVQPSDSVSQKAPIVEKPGPRKSTQQQQTPVLFQRSSGAVPMPSTTSGAPSRHVGDMQPVTSNPADGATSVPNQGSIQNHLPVHSMGTVHPTPGPASGHFIGPRQHQGGPYSHQGHSGYPNLQSHPHLGMHQPSMQPLGHGAHPAGTSVGHSVNGVSGPSVSGMSQKMAVGSGQGMHPAHLNHVASQNSGSRVMSGDPSSRLPNGPLRPYMSGGYSVAGPAPRPMSQGLPGRGHGPHEMLGSMPDGSSMKNGDIGYMGSNHMLMHQRPHLQGFNSSMSTKRPDVPGRHSDTPCLDDFAHMGLITDLLE
ncbi:hypothetical protein BSKO_08829 [Bryopsis sp. KO-2023]|nr:hypothetical protein BSKO_08829 [Bryopsis sp. KO-2023]